MSDPPFSPELRSALDSFAPPPLPPGFAARVADRARAGREAPLPRLRRGRTWRRAGWIAGGVAGLSLMSAAAAATGVFGEPIHVPVISQIAQSLEIVPPPVAATTARPDPALARAEASEVTQGPARERIDALLDDPEFRALNGPEKRAELRRTARELVASGEARPREVVEALRDTARERVAALPPEQRERIEQRLSERRETRREIIATPAAERLEARRQIRRERLLERRAQQLGEASGNPAPPAEESFASPEGSDAAVR